MPADGFFEWLGAKEARRPVWFHAPDGGLILFAGLYESWQNPQDQQWRRSFTILTTSANGTVAPVHDRMPVILPPDRLDDWLHIPAQDPAAYAKSLRPLLAAAPEDALIATEVSRRVNAVANDDEACLTPATNEPVATPRLL